MRPVGRSVAAADLDTVLEVVGDCAEAPDAAAYRERALAGVRRLLPCAVATFNEVDRLSACWRVCSDPPGVLFAGYERALVGHAKRNPLMRHQLRSLDGRAMMISDFTTRTGFLREDTEGSVYARMGLEDTIAISFSGSGGVIGIALSDSWERFGERDRAVLDLLRPHLEQAWRALGTGPLTPRELEVLRLVADGRTDKEIATELDIQRRTASKHLEHIYEKLGVHTRTAAARALSMRS